MLLHLKKKKTHCCQWHVHHIWSTRFLLTFIGGYVELANSSCGKVYFFSRHTKYILCLAVLAIQSMLAFHIKSWETYMRSNCNINGPVLKQLVKEIWSVKILKNNENGVWLLLLQASYMIRYVRLSLMYTVENTNL